MEEELRQEIAELRIELKQKDSTIETLATKLRAYEAMEKTKEPMTGLNLPMMDKHRSLDNRDIGKFSRQIILPEFRVKSQKILKGSSVLIVGCGGLGCPAAVYLAGAGVGRIGLVDYDTVELSNLHRQILHTQTRIGELKCVSVATALAELNPESEYVPISAALTSDNALQLVKQFDIVLDCSDNVATRYLLNDACVMCDRPLVSGSALRWEGQLTVYNLNGGPTYRCLYPTPPPPSAVTNCSDGGVLGVVPGVIGVLQGLETIKILTQGSSSLGGKLLLFDALEAKFRMVKLRNRNPDVALVDRLIDYVQFCGSGATDKEQGISILDKQLRISVTELAEMRRSSEMSCLLVDVRSDTEFEMGAIEGSTNIPLDSLQANVDKHLADLTGKFAAGETQEKCAEIVFICRRGNDSQRACALVAEYLKDNVIKVGVRDVVGGLQSWASKVDDAFPIY